MARDRRSVAGEKPIPEDAEAHEKTLPDDTSLQNRTIQRRSALGQELTRINLPEKPAFNPTTFITPSSGVMKFLEQLPIRIRPIEKMRRTMKLGPVFP